MIEKYRIDRIVSHAGWLSDDREGHKRWRGQYHSQVGCLVIEKDRIDRMVRPVSHAGWLSGDREGQD